MYAELSFLAERLEKEGAPQRAFPGIELGNCKKQRSPIFPASRHKFPLDTLTSRHLDTSTVRHLVAFPCQTSSMAFRFANDDDSNWPFREREINRGLVSNQQSLDAMLKDLLARNSQGSIDREDLARSISQMQASVQHIDTLLREVIGEESYTAQCPAHATGLAQQVFDVPELLEMILVNLSIEELLAAQFINRQFRDAVNSSTKLQRKLSLLPHTSKDFYAPFEENVAPGFYFYSRASQEDLLTDLQVLREPIGTERWPEAMQAKFDPELPKIGDRCRRMLVFQPPIKEVRVLTTCCARWSARHTDIQMKDSDIVRNEDGITVGDLLDAASALKEHHSQCVWADSELHDPETGVVEVQTVFETAYPMRRDDPIITARIESMQEYAKKQNTMYEENRRVSAFRMVKLDGEAAPNRFAIRKS